MNEETVAVLAISNKAEKEKGWVRISPVGGGSVWQELGAHFEKSLGETINQTGIYSMIFRNVANLGENSKYEVVSAKKLKGFDEVVEWAKQG